LKGGRSHDNGQVFSGLILLGNAIIEPVKLLFTFILGFLALLWGDVGIFVVLVELVSSPDKSETE
jgi:hypothetical protein